MIIIIIIIILMIIIIKTKIMIIITMYTDKRLYESRQSTQTSFSLNEI